MLLYREISVSLALMTSNAAFTTASLVIAVLGGGNISCLAGSNFPSDVIYFLRRLAGNDLRLLPRESSVFGGFLHRQPEITEGIL